MSYAMDRSNAVFRIMLKKVGMVALIVLLVSLAFKV